MAHPPSYTPSIYLPGSIGRFRQYPRVVRTPIPGANVSHGELIWGRQNMNLDNTSPKVRYSVARLPLLGVGGNYLGQTLDYTGLESPSTFVQDALASARANWKLLGLALAGGAFGMHMAHRRGWMR